MSKFENVKTPSFECSEYSRLILGAELLFEPDNVIHALLKLSVATVLP